MNGLKVYNWEWILVDTYDARGRPVTRMECWPREYTEVPYVHPKAEVDENEEWVEFGGPPILW